MQTTEMVAEGVEETTADPAIAAGEVVVEATNSAEAIEEVEVVQTARDYWGEEYWSVRHRGFTVHWGPEQSRRYLEVVVAAAAEVAAGTTMEAAADRVRAHVVDAIGEERLEPATARGATTKSGSTELGEGACAAAEATKEKKREKNKKKKERRRIGKEAAAAEGATADPVGARGVHGGGEGNNSK